MLREAGSIDVSPSNIVDIKPFSSGAKGHAWPPSKARFEICTIDRSYTLGSVSQDPDDKRKWIQSLAEASGTAFEDGSVPTKKAATSRPEAFSLKKQNKKVSSMFLMGAGDSDTRQGWLSTRRAFGFGGWKRRFCVIRGCHMLVYRDASMAVLKSETDLTNAVVDFVLDDSGDVMRVIRINLKAEGKVVASEDWLCEDNVSAKEWHRRIVAATQKDMKAEDAEKSQTASEPISCDIFQPHPIFAFAQCRTCGIARSQVINTRKLKDITLFN